VWGWCPENPPFSGQKGREEQKEKEKRKESPAAAAYIFGKLKAYTYMGTLDCWTVPA
jgi:hypothetical protein